MFRYFLLLLVGLFSVYSLTSCSSPVTNGDGSVSRQGAFLEDMGNGVCSQYPSGLMWQVKESKKFSTSTEATEYVKKLQLGGFTDWRLPSRDEYLDLAELLEIKKYDCSLAIKRALWVRDSNGTIQSGHWEDYPMCGGSDFRWVNDKNGSVRAVRP